jgi:hypothetical protein
MALADDLLDLLPHRLQADPQRLQGPGRDAFTLVDQAQQDVLGADVVVVEHPGFFLRQGHNPAGPVSEPLEHLLLRLSGSCWPPAQRPAGASSAAPEAATLPP